MKHISLNVLEEIKHVLPNTLEKDLKDNEEICSVCHGLGIIKRDYRFGIEEDVNSSKIDWYDNEYLVWCPNCYFGVVKKCEYCDKILPKNRTKCDCEKQREIDKEERIIKYQETIARATEVDLKDVVTYLYDEESNKYYSDIYDFVDYHLQEYRDGSGGCNDFDEYFQYEMPEILWLCDNIDISMDADSIIESACDELHEDAEDSISGEDRKELQKFLDDWCKKQAGTTTLYPNYNRYIRVKKEWFNGISK